MTTEATITHINEFQARAEWIAAFLAAQGAFPPISKTKTASIKTKSGSDYSYSYADLPDILDAVQPALAANGLGIAQSVVGQLADLAVETRIYHSGGWVEVFGPLHLPGGDDARSAGSAVTYARRYALCAALGIAPDEDDDGGAATPRRSPNPTEPVSADEPHCPACKAINGEIVGVFQNDKKPFWRCKNKECAGTSEKNGRKFVWAGWHESWEQSVDEWFANNPQYAGPQVKDVSGRGERWRYVLKELLEVAGLEKEEAKPVAKAGLVAAIHEGQVDVEAALGRKPDDRDPSDSELAAIAQNLTASEADCVVAQALGFVETTTYQADEAAEAPFA